MPETKGEVDTARFGTELERIEQLQALLGEVEARFGVIEREMSQLGSLLFKMSAALTLRREVVQGPMPVTDECPLVEISGTLKGE